MLTAERGRVSAVGAGALTEGTSPTGRPCMLRTLEQGVRLVPTTIGLERIVSKSAEQMTVFRPIPKND